MQDEKKLISVVIPAYCEEGNIPVIFDKLQEVLNEYKYEVIFVNDASSDNTLSAIKLLSDENDNVKYLSFSRNFGHQAALRAGLNKAKGAAVISMDADLQHPPEILPQMIKLWKEGNEVVFTKRIDGKETSFFKKITSLIFYKSLNLLSEVHLEAGTADFRLLDRKVVDVINKMKEKEIFFRGMIPWVGFKSYGLEYQVQKRHWGRSSYTLKKMLSLAVSGLTSFSTKPLTIAVYLGFLVSGVSFLYLLYALVIKVLNLGADSGWTSVIGSILLLGGVQLISLGIIGQYIAKIYDQVRDRPGYIVSEESDS